MCARSIRQFEWDGWVSVRVGLTFSHATRQSETEKRHPRQGWPGAGKSVRGELTAWQGQTTNPQGNYCKPELRARAKSGKTGKITNEVQFI